MKGGKNVSRKDNRDYVYLAWKDPNTGRNYIVGELSRNSQYEFSYKHEINKAIEKGFKPLISFEDINKKYKSDTLFPTFSSRLPDKKRRGIEKILLKYGLKEYDSYKLLKRSGAKLPIDNLEFIEPIFDECDENIRRIFYIAGSRYHIGCEGDDCDYLNLQIGDQLKLVLEPENLFDENAIKITDKKENPLGFVPKYFSEGITKYLKQGKNYKCTVLEVNKNWEYQECIKIELEVYVQTENYAR